MIVKLTYKAKHSEIKYFQIK